MMETIKMIVTTPTLTPRIVSDERSLFARSVSTAIKADSLMSSIRIEFQISDCRGPVFRGLAVNTSHETATTLEESAIANRQSEIISFRSQCLNRIQFRSTPGGPEAADDADNG